MHTGLNILVAALLTLGLFFPLSAAQAAGDTMGGVSYSDRSFLSAMIAHHQDGVRMSQDALPKLKDGRVKAWAKEVIEDQRKEIEEMGEMLKPMGGSDAKAATAMRHMDMLPAHAASADQAFVAGMLEHHKGALNMAAEALVLSKDPKVIELAVNIIEAQAKEMRDYKEWLLKAGGK